ncbi:monofunctional biosynthetic peptidoglycan transglycosylase [Bartonella sp. HY038]|uniref:monofunctional biosynthetic peptidoglycan transglycosylase n=1 Tax=Bartonella sp. HY038 TaxID=2759660 RepID=UPI0015F86831|nr:monofunctional biosynthetic peptidoglycan transglycosylase [Bartonella sp. HY038]
MVLQPPDKPYKSSIITKIIANKRNCSLLLDKDEIRNEGETKKTLVKKIALGLILLLLLPFFLLLFYNLPFIKPISTLMLRDVVLLRGYDRQWVSIRAISPNLINAVMMAEDGKFCSHNGVDWDALGDVLDNDGGPNRGASTITMQMVKNLFLWQDRSYVRKAIEIPIALGANILLSKQRTMEIYLNIAEWGPGIYGAEAASRHYFNRSSSNLTPRQGALLAAALPNPYIRNPTKPGPGMSQLARVFESRARNSGAYIACVN